MVRKCENHVSLANHIIFTFVSYYFHMIFTFWGPGAAARGPGRAWPAAALGPGPGFRAPKCENNMKIICKNVEIM